VAFAWRLLPDEDGDWGCDPHLADEMQPMCPADCAVSSKVYRALPARDEDSGRQVEGSMCHPSIATCTRVRNPYAPSCVCSCAASRAYHRNPRSAAGQDLAWPTDRRVPGCLPLTCAVRHAVDIPPGHGAAPARGSYCLLP